MTWDVIQGDCLDTMRGMEPESVDAVVCDPPYGLEFMGKAWDRLGDVGQVSHTGPGRDGRPNVFGSLSVAYYGSANVKCRKCGHWKFSGTPCECHSPDFPNPKTRQAQIMQDWHAAWAVEALRVLKPSSYLLAFGGTRTWHRLACAIEDAGFEIRDTLMWLYGSGFPKGKSCLKPAWEPVILARKPGPMRELGIEECRIAGAVPSVPQPAFGSPTGAVYGMQAGEGRNGEMSHASGRWPANLILDEEAGRELDGSTGVLTSSKRDPRHSRARSHGNDYGAMASATYRDDNTYGDSGGPSRFFYCPKASRRERNAGLEGMEERQNPKFGHGNGETDPMTASHLTKMSNHHPTVKPVALMQWLVRLVAREGDLVLDPFLGSGTTGAAAVTTGRDFIGIEKEAEYAEIARRRIGHAEQSTQPTLFATIPDGSWGTL